jgi:hypothetical protein
MFFAIARYAAIHSDITRYVILTKEGSIKILQLRFATFRMTTKSYLSFTLIREMMFFAIVRYAAIHSNITRYVILTKGDLLILQLHFATFRMTTKSYLSFTLIRDRKFFVIKRYAAIHSVITRYVILTKEGFIRILRLRYAPNDTTLIT